MLSHVAGADQGAAGRGYSVIEARFFLELFVRPGRNFANRPAKTN